MRFSLILEILLPVLIVLFAVMMIHGAAVSETGYGALKRLEEERTIAQAILDDLQAERQWMENRANLITSKSLDPDMVDERVRDVLGYAENGDIVVSRKNLRSAIAILKEQGSDTPPQYENEPALNTVASNDLTVKPAGLDVISGLIIQSAQ